jgi:hypothetical protein
MSTNLTQQEYVVTLKNYDDLEGFYHDIETLGGDLYIPDRAVESTKRRPLSRNTNYMLTAEEAANLQNDPRVLSVSPLQLELDSIQPFYTQSATWDKSSSNNSNYKNWGLLRSVIGQQRSNWGSNGNASETGTIQVNAEGRNVDVVIIDGLIDPAHPEYALNADGTGGSRVVQFNWLSLTNVVSGGANGTYVYTPYSGADVNLTRDNNHGAHVAGTVAGNTQGWARKANIYNISPYSTDPNGLNALELWDYVRAWHNSKPVNPVTGRRNPTICNCSYGASLTFPNSVGYTTTGPTYAIYRGLASGDTNFVTPLTKTQLTAVGVYAKAGTEDNPITEIPYYSNATAADITDAIADGIIVVAAAGNESANIDVPSGIDYNNRFVAKYGVVNYSWYYRQGSAPGSVPAVLCIGAVGSSVAEYKATFSNCGPRVDLYAPGQNIMSSFNSTLSFGGVNDPRNSTYKIGKSSGTSMASPQVCGVIAAMLETYPNMTQAKAIEYLAYYAKNAQMGDTGGGTTDLNSLQGSENKYLAYKEERETVGLAFPKVNYSPRPISGAVYPRSRIKRTL